VFAPFVVAGAIVLAAVALSDSGASAASLPPCPVYSKWPTKPVTPDVLAAITKYYTARHLAPVAVYGNKMSVLNVKLMSGGTRYCRNPDGSRSGYVGIVPARALMAVIVHVKHRAYPVTGSASTFITLAKLRVTGWKVISDDTGP
jgi:hypothetical protein